MYFYSLDQLKYVIFWAFLEFKSKKILTPLFENLSKKKFVEELKKFLLNHKKFGPLFDLFRYFLHFNLFRRIFYPLKSEILHVYPISKNGLD